MMHITIQLAPDETPTNAPGLTASFKAFHTWLGLWDQLPSWSTGPNTQSQAICDLQYVNVTIYSTAAGLLEAATQQTSTPNLPIQFRTDDVDTSSSFTCWHWTDPTTGTPMDSESDPGFYGEA